MFAEVRDSTATTGAYFRSSGKPIRGAMARESDSVPQNLWSGYTCVVHCLTTLCYALIDTQVWRRCV